MNPLKRALSIISIRIKESLLIYLKKRNKSIITTKKVNSYIDALYQRNIPDYILDLYKSNSCRKDSTYQTPLNQLGVLGFLLKSSQSKKILEIGAYQGITGLYFSSIVGEKGLVFCCEKDSDYIQDIERLWKKYPEKNLTLLKGDALPLMNQLIEDGHTFDFIYIDADKKQYPDYLNLAKKLSRSGTIIAMDNMLWAGLVPEKTTRYSHARILDDLNQQVFSETGSHCCIIPAWDGLVLLQIR